MLLDVLGVLIGFAAVMLLFSLLVTSIGHFIQGLAKKRYAVLKQTLQKFAGTLQKELPESSQFLVQAIDEMLDEKTLEGKLIKEAAFVAKEEIHARILAKCGVLSDVDLSEQAPGDVNAEKSLQALEAYFPKLETAMSRQFKHWMNTLSVIIALIISVSFHLSAFDLLRNISANPELRAAYTAFGEQKLRQGQNAALAGALPDTTESLGEMRAHVNSELAVFNFSVFPNHCDCYFESKNPRRIMSNIVGMLISTLLISLGAPFWFRALQNLFRLREQVANIKS